MSNSSVSSNSGLTLFLTICLIEKQNVSPSELHVATGSLFIKIPHPGQKCGNLVKCSNLAIYWTFTDTSA